MSWRSQSMTHQCSRTLQGMPTGSSTSMGTRYDSEHRRALDTMKGDRQKEVEKLKAEAAALLASLQTTTQKLDKVSARKSILEREVMLLACTKTVNRFCASAACCGLYSWPRMMRSWCNHLLTDLLLSNSLQQVTLKFLGQHVAFACAASVPSLPALRCMHRERM